MSSEQPELQKGSRVAGRYRIEAPIAKGGMGAVYVALDESSGARVALKRRGGHNPRAARMFEREYHTLRGLEHPRIIDVYDYGVDDEGAYYTMELLDGQDLRALAPLPFARACKYLRDVASSLSLLHVRRLVHRDLSPGNVRVTGDDRCKLIDFGVLASFGAAEHLAGTPPMVPPESLGGAPLDQRADLFSLGALAYFLLTGRHAFPAKTIDELPERWRLAPPAPSKLRKSLGILPDDAPIPEALDALVSSLLSRNPEARPSSAAELIDRLTAIAGLPPDTETLAAESYLASGSTVGREREHERLLGRLDAAMDGLGGALVIDADSGLGSSRLLADLAVAAQLKGALPLVVDAKLRRGNYGAVHDLIAKLLEAAPELALQAARPYAAALAHLSGELSERLGQPALRAVKLAPGELRMRVQVALADWLCAVATQRPLLLAIDDAQHLDEASAAVLATLAHRVRDHRMMLVSVLKADRTKASGAVMTGLIDVSARMKLAPLDRRQVQELLTGLFGSVPRLGRLAEQTYRATAGSPLLCLELVRQLVRSDVIRHAGGVWLLPNELDAADLPELAEPHAGLIARLSPEGLRLGEALSVHVGALQLEQCLAIGQSEGVGNVWNALQELTREGVLGHSATSYHFVHDGLRLRLLGSVAPARVAALHRQMGHQFALRSEGDLDAMLDAGFHLLQGGDEGGEVGRGADLLATAGLLLGYDSDEMGAAIAPLRAALEVFRKQARPPHEIVKLLGPLCNAAWYCDRTLADEFGEETLRMLADQIGLTLAGRLRPFLGKHLSLYLGLGSAALAFSFGRGRRGITALRETIVMYFNCVLSLCGVAAICLDAERVKALVPRLEHLTALGKDHAASVSHRMAELLALAPQEYAADAIAGCRALLQRLESDKPVQDLPSDSKLMILGGLRYELGVFESFHDGPQALQAAEALDATGLELYRMVADQVRANYHACRGEIELADLHRDRVELYAVQAGSAWQAEVWAPASAILSSLLTGDLIGMKRSCEELERLSSEIPSLRRYAQIARGAMLLLRGEAAASLALSEEVLRDGSPRSFVGWGALIASTTRALNALGQHERAKALCEATLSQLSEQDIALTAMYLPLLAELTLAEAQLGQVEAADARMDALLLQHRNGGPTTLGMLHATCAKIAILQADVLQALHHVAEMERAVRPTHNPALLQQCEALRTRVAVLQHGASDPRDILADADAVTSAARTAPRGLSGLDTAGSAKRLERALSLIIAETGSESGILFAVVRRGLSVLAPDPALRPPEHLLDQLDRDIRAFERARRRSSTELARAQATMTVGTMIEPTRPRLREHDYRTVILSADGERAAGVVAVWVGEHQRPVDDSLVRAITSSLILSGDLGDPRATSPHGRAH